ncbi:MAG: glycosyltransferase family 2 protein [Deltaproteobacteria bacterium]|nr:MAG: glycosyltransferase family 2 protein [Deltaproteobacteria bacterium]
MTSDAEWPPVSVVMPMRNEAAMIAETLGAMRRQDYPGELELLCVDGMSTDGTRELVAAIAAEDPRVRLVDNPSGRTPNAMNLGLRAARHPLVLRMDAHAIAAPDYARRSVRALEDTGADCVGGRWDIVGRGVVGRAIAAALTSPFGVGTATWRSSADAGWTDTVPFGLWRRDRLLALGGFDEALTRNQDYELNHRLRASGGRIWYDPAIRSTYFARKGPRALTSQYLQYGFWKARVMRLHPRSTRLRHLVAPAFVLGLVLGAVLAAALGGVWTGLYLGGLGLYAALALTAAVLTARRARAWAALPLLPPLFLLLHLSWGAGFWGGFARFWLLPPPRAGSDEGPP